MALRFRKTIKIAPGIKLNVSKGGVSASLGPRGAKVNIGKNGTRVTGGIPGTGLSSSRLYKSSKRGSRSASPPPEYSQAQYAVAALSVEVTAIFFWINLSGFLSLLGAVTAFLIPGIYLARFASSRQKQAAAAKEEAELAQEYAEVMAKATPKSVLRNDKADEPGAYDSNFADTSDAREDRNTAGRTTLIPMSAVDDGLAAFESSAASGIDYLGLAAQAGGKAGLAVKAGEFDSAWFFYHEQKSLYLQHAANGDWSARDTLTLDASVHENLADVLRLQKRHHEALPHIIYWISASRHRPIKRHTEKLRAYFNRCKLTSTTLEEVEAYLSSRRGLASFPALQKQVKRWTQKG